MAKLNDGVGHMNHQAVVLQIRLQHLLKRPVSDRDAYRPLVSFYNPLNKV